MNKWLRDVRDYFLPHERNNWRPHFFSTTSLAVIVLSLVVLEGAYFADTQFIFPRTNFLASVLPATLLDLTNADRAANGASPVTENQLLDQAAQEAAQDMAANDYFAHVSPSGVTPWDWLTKVGYNYSYAGENLAVNFTDSDAVENAWMASPTHRANIVKPQYTEVGFGTAEGEYEGQKTTFVVTFFGTPAPVAVAEAKPETTSPARATAPIAVTNAPAAAPQVLGTATAPVTPSLLDRVLASPASFAEALAAILFALVALLLMIAVFTKIKIQHASVLAGGALLLALSAGALLMDRGFAAGVQVPQDTESASAVTALAQ